MSLAEALARAEARFAEREPEIQAFLREEGRWERLRREARELEARWPDPEARPPLYGVLLGVKDIFHVDGFETRAGSRLPPAALAGPEARVVTALREQGVLILGKTVSTEFAFFAPGPTRNPRNPEHTPGGSSSGSAAAVAAGLCPLALGTQTIGSILRPAAFCGVVGVKPSRTQISNEGVIPLAPSLDQAGYFTRDAELACLVGRLVCDWWRFEPTRQPRMAVPVGPYLSRISKEAMVHFRTTCERLEDAGYNIQPVEAMEDFDDIVERHFRIVSGQAARVHRRWFAEYEELYDPRTAELIRKGQEVSDVELKLDLADAEKLLDDLTRLMSRYHIDLWLSPPALGAAPRGLESTGDPVMNLPWTQAAMPAISLPVGTNEAGLPMGLQMAAGLGGDAELLIWAEQIERVLRA
ncbi:MAG: amidase [Thermoanaerobaculia bacterium]